MRDSHLQFGEGGKKALAFAREEARRFNHNYVGTEHLLLGLLLVEEGLAAAALDSLGVEFTSVRSAVEHITGRGERQVVGHIGLTPRAKLALQRAREEAARLDAGEVGTEHLLLGLIGESEGIAAGVLESLGVSLDRARATVLKLLGDPEAARKWQAEHPASHHRPIWEYLVIPTEVRNGTTYVARTYAGPGVAAELTNAPIERVLESLAGEGWALAGIDPSGHTRPGAGPLCVLKRRRSD